MSPKRNFLYVGATREGQKIRLSADFLASRFLGLLPYLEYHPSFEAVAVTVAVKENMCEVWAALGQSLLAHIISTLVLHSMNRAKS